LDKIDNFTERCKAFRFNLDFRTWTIPEKGKTFVAKFVNLEDNRVNLQTATGRAAFIDLKLLSETDQEWIRSKLQDGE
jgi:hypothetical protein